MPEVPLGDNEVHVWYAEPAQVEVLERWNTCWELMVPSERNAMERLSLKRKRQEFLVTRSMVRFVLSLYCDVKPQQWRFAVNAHGRPSIREPADACRLCYNVSHTDGLVAMAVTRDRDVGIDVESLGRSVPSIRIARRFFSQVETEALESLDPESRGRQFLEYWTLKEAYIKARGLGLSCPLDQFSILLHEPGSVIGIAFGPGIDDDPAIWQFARDQYSSQHLTALAIRRDHGPDLSIRCRPICW